MNKRKYVRPVMTEVVVEMEKGFLKASEIIDKEKSDVSINEQAGKGDPVFGTDTEISWE